MHALEDRTQRNYESSEGVAIFVTLYSTSTLGDRFWIGDLGKVSMNTLGHFA